MTTATMPGLVFADDVAIPEELEERTSKWVGRVRVLGFAMPTGKRLESVTSRNETPRPQLVYSIEPLSFKYDTDPSKFSDPVVDINFDEKWVNVYDKNGDLMGKNTPIDAIKVGYKKLGYSLMTNKDAQAIQGKTFVFETRKFSFKAQKPNAITGALEESETTPTYFAIPLEQVADDWQPETPPTTRQRPRDWRGGGAVTTGSQINSNSAAADPAVIAKLKDLLNGKEEGQYSNALVTSGDPSVLVAPYITEATTDTAALTARMVAAGMTVVDGKLVA